MAQLKPPTTYEQQLEILKNRNVVIDDPAFCANVLQSVGYYRFTAYFLPFKQYDGNYLVGTRFQRIYQIYEFDRKLRGILFSALEEVEVFLRAKISHYHAHKYGAEGYLNENSFEPSRHQQEKFKANIEREIYNNKRSAFVMHHQKQYDGHFPLWVIIELFTFGMLSRFFDDMKTSDKKKLANELYGTVPQNISSWLRCCTDLRNICAHYGRLYYRIFPAIPANVSADFKQIRRLWGAILALQSLYPDSEKWNTEILNQLNALFDEYREDITLGHIGFPDDWLQCLKKE